MSGEKHIREVNMNARKRLFALMGMIILLVSLSVPMVQCAPDGTGQGGEGAGYGGKLNVGWPNVIDSFALGPSIGRTAMGLIYWRVVYNEVWSMGPPPEYEAVPMVAESWETEDNVNWVFHIRQDITFHDGTPLTAEDVAYTFDEFCQAEPRWIFNETNVESYEIVDEYTIKVKMKYLCAPYPPLAWTPVVPKHIWKPYFDTAIAAGDITGYSYDNEDSIGCGPFKVKEFKPGGYIWFEANEDYWKGKPPVDEMVWKSYGSEDALLMALKSGEIDMLGTGGVSPLVAGEFEELENVDLVVSTGMGIYSLTFNVLNDTALAKDKNVRKAIMHGVDRDRIIDMIYLGYAQKADSIVYQEVAEHNPDLPQYEYNVDRAREILDQGGYVDTNGDDIRNDPATGENLNYSFIVTQNDVNGVNVGTLIKEQLEDIGIHITMKPVDEGTFATFYYEPQEGQFDIGWGALDPSPNGNWVWECMVGGKTFNSSGYANPVFDDLFDKMMMESDQSKRKEYVYGMQAILSEDLPYGWLWRTDVIDPVNNKFGGWVPSMGGLSSWNNFWSYSTVYLEE